MTRFPSRPPAVIAILLASAISQTRAEQKPSGRGDTSTNVALSPELEDIAAKLVANFEALSSVTFKYTFEVDGKHKFVGSFVTHEGKVRLERKDLSTPWELAFAPDIDPGNNKDAEEGLATA